MLHMGPGQPPGGRHELEEMKTRSVTCDAMPFLLLLSVIIVIMTAIAIGSIISVFAIFLAVILIILLCSSASSSSSSSSSSSLSPSSSSSPFKRRPPGWPGWREGGPDAFSEVKHTASHICAYILVCLQIQSVVYNLTHHIMSQYRV